MKNNFYNCLIETLKTNPEFVSEDKSLLKNKIIERAMRLDDSFIELLFNNDLIRERLFKKVGDNYIFDKAKGEYVEEHDVMDDIIHMWEEKERND